MLGTEDHYEGQKISAKDIRSVVRSTKALHEVRHEVRGPDAYMGFLHEVYALDWVRLGSIAFVNRT